ARSFTGPSRRSWCFSTRLRIVHPARAPIVVADVALAFRRPLGIQRDDDGLVATSFSKVEPFLIELLIAKRVHLYPEMASGGFGQIFERSIGVGAHGEHRAARRRGPVSGDLAVGMRPLVTTARRD